MAKELYIYQPIHRYTAEAVVKSLNEVANDEELTIRLNTPGGEVNAGWAIISKLSERTGKTNMIIDGEASSMGAISLMFADNVIANDTSSIMFHKAAYPSWYEPNQQEQQTLKTINSQFQDKLTKKVSGKPGADAFLARVFESDVRNDVEISPVEAKNLGIVDEIRQLEPKAFDFATPIVAMVENNESKGPESGVINNNLNKKSMDLAKLKAEHPALYAQIIEEGEKRGVQAERIRAKAWLAFIDIDAKAVSDGIKEGKEFDQAVSADFTAKGIAMARVGDHEKDNSGSTKTPENGKTEEELKAEANEKEAIEALKKAGIKI